MLFKWHFVVNQTDINILILTHFNFDIHNLKLSDRVATDLENLERSGNLKDTSESQGIFFRIPKVREKSGNFVV